MIYSPNAPYEIMSTKLIDFTAMCRLRRFARYWDLIANSGRFVHSLPVLLDGRSPFEAFMALSDWLWETTHQAHGIALVRLFELVLRYVQSQTVVGVDRFATALLQDYQRDGRTDTPSFLSERVLVESPRSNSTASMGLARQLRHGVS
jgi:hypothetical protein